MKTKMKAKTIWLTAFLVFLCYEIYTLASKEKGDTLSEVVWEMTDTMAPITTFASGVVVGHWFWPRHK